MVTLKKTWLFLQTDFHWNPFHIVKQSALSKWKITAQPVSPLIIYTDTIELIYPHQLHFTAVLGSKNCQLPELPSQLCISPPKLPAAAAALTHHTAKITCCCTDYHTTCCLEYLTFTFADLVCRIKFDMHLRITASKAIIYFKATITSCPDISPKLSKESIFPDFQLTRARLH